MDPLTADRIRGTWGTLLLPIDDNDAIDFARLSDEIDYLIDIGVDGIYSNGSAGELHNQDEDEFDHISSMLSGKCESAGVDYQLGASHMDPRISLSRARRAAAYKPGAIQVILPDWVPCSLAEAGDFLLRIAETVAPVGLVLYLPGHAKRAQSVENIGKLAQRVPSIVGLKVLGGDKAWYESMRQHAPHLSVFIPGHDLASGTQLGAHGSYSNVACLSPGGAMRWQKLMQMDMPAALELEGRIKKFMVEHIVPYRDQQGHSNTALDKLLAAVGGWGEVGTRLRWPYRGVPAPEADKLGPIARHMLPELFAD
ncbi:MAG: dihydrodipicolinate synthase family protein [Phycisphaerales bacterium]